MSEKQSFSFGPYRLDPDTEQLWRGKQVVKLTGKALALLRYLVERAGQLVTKDEVLVAVWPQTVVSDAALTRRVQELREALHDDPRAPRYIETVHRRGFRWIAPVTATAPLVQSPKSKVQGSKLEPAPSTQHPAPTLVGREAELERLHGWLDKALNGERQIVFITGEPGIGKTTVVEAFFQSLESRVQRLASKDQTPQPHPVQTLDPRRQTLDASLWIGRGQCIAHYGAGEAYLPVLEALGRLCRQPGGERFIELLSQHAPSWLVQMPALLSSAELETLQRKVAGATRERMLRKMAEALEVVTRERPLVLWLEDLHWSDYSTLDWLAFVARRREPARLLVIGTYRPVEVIAREHPLRAVKQELQLHGYCGELPLELLSEGAVREYLAVRVAGGAQSVALLPGLAQVVYERTEGNPLFMVTVVDDWVRQGVLVQGESGWELQVGLEEVGVGVPESLQQLIEQRMERLSPEDRRVLEVASVAGAEFSAAAVAAGVEAEVGEVEARCADLMRREQFLQTHGVSEWPDGTVAARYSFLHALYQHVLYERVPAGQRSELHRRIGEREERAYGERAREIAAELAVHFERGRDYRRAVHYLQQAGENAVRRHAYQEAIDHLTGGLELLKALPDTPERCQQELLLQVTLGAPLLMTQGYVSPEVEAVYGRATELCQQLREPPHLLLALFGLFRFHLVRGELHRAHELGEQLVRLAHSEPDSLFLPTAHAALGGTVFHLGEFAAARGHLEHGISVYERLRHSPLIFQQGEDTGIVCLSYAAWSLQVLGYSAQALKRSQEALILAQELAHPFSEGFALGHAVMLHQWRREWQVAQEQEEALMALAGEQGFAHLLALTTILRGRTLAEGGQREETIAQMRQDIAAYRATGVELGQPYYLALLAEAYGKAGQIEEGLAVLAEALARAQQTEEHWCDAELYRLTGELTLAQSRVQRLASSVTNPQSPIPNPQAETEACFLKAIEIARKQQAKSLELRAVMSLSRLWQQQGKKDEARQMLAEIYGWFTEGFDTADLKEARALLEELSEHHEARSRMHG